MKCPGILNNTGKNSKGERGARSPKPKKGAAMRETQKRRIGKKEDAGEAQSSSHRSKGKEDLRSGVLTGKRDEGLNKMEGDVHRFSDSRPSRRRHGKRL